MDKKCHPPFLVPRPSLLKGVVLRGFIILTLCFHQLVVFPNSPLWMGRARDQCDLEICFPEEDLLANWCRLLSSYIR